MSETPTTRNDAGFEHHPAPPLREKAEELGCTCEWHGYGSIARFDPACPIFDQHRQPKSE